jgi:hypothetical protein
MWFLVLVGAAFVFRAALDLGRLGQRPPGPVRRLFVLRGISALIGVAGCVAVPVAVDRMLRAGTDWAAVLALGLPLGAGAVLLLTQLIHSRRIVSSLAPGQAERWRE